MPSNPAKKKKTVVVWVWTCCSCGRGGPDMMILRVEFCPSCRHPRCTRCEADRVRQSR
ncbi:hypothetical protein QBC34DRAFT_411160 [Podospora aff. communis PSN243]|uniref:Uncharacterized protein n=1 Tax=Podospora aff. communis PSN243 TaxID=3040156 RepID=A0AAV9GDY8_9PEZI|nr:hypothetical protein QBC34DRAFT_411160 [Podospora aff. communis PSN243]